MTDRPLIFDLDVQELRRVMTERRMPSYRADQVQSWVFRRHLSDPQEMSNLSPHDRRVLNRCLRFGSSHVVTHQQASDGVQKLLLAWEPTPVDGERTRVSADWPQTECVMIPMGNRRTACISSQVGCPVGCHFCASGIGGFEQNLSAGQMIEQVWRMETLPGVGRITHVVFMGMGEPLANFTAVTKAIRLLMAPWCMGISGRRLTVSTVGLPAQIRRLGALRLPITLAISLHAPNDELRRTLIPWADNVTLNQLVEAAQDYFAQTHREITLEYILLRSVNDRPEHAHQLVRIARRLRCNVNLIRYNEVKDLPYDRPISVDVHRFQTILVQAGVNTLIRASRGRDISAACGQLRHERGPEHVTL